MRKLIVFLSFFLLSCFYSWAQECGTIDFPRFLPDTVCTLDSVLIGTQDELEENQVYGTGILEWNNAFYLNPEESLADQYIDFAIAGYDKCGQYITDSATVFVKKCQDCYPIPEPDIPDTVCRNADPFVVANADDFDYASYSQNLEEINDDFYFNPSVFSTDTLVTIGLNVFNYCQDSFYVSQEIHVKNCEPDCDNIQFLEDLPDSICKDDNKIYIAASNIFKYPVDISGKGIYTEHINAGLDSIFYFDPSLVSSADYNQNFEIAIQSHDSCHTSISKTIKVQACSDCIDSIDFEVTLPDTICKDDDVLFYTLIDSKLYDYPITVEGIGVVEGTVWGSSMPVYYFRPDMVPDSVYGKYFDITIHVDDDCQKSLTKSVLVQTCNYECIPEPVESPFLLPDSICFSTSPIVLEALNMLDIWGDGIVYNKEISFDPSVPASRHYAVVYASVNNNCGDEVIVSDTVFIDACTTINGIEDWNGDDNITIYPNPVSDKLTISGSGVKSVNILNVTGKVVINGKRLDYNMQDLPEGIYFIQLLMENGEVKTEKILKSN